MNLNAGERTIVFRNFVYLPDKSFPVCAIFSNFGTTGPPTAAGSGSPTCRRCSRRSSGRSLPCCARPVEVTGAGRTDTGVNASYYVAHFDCADVPCPILAQTVYKLNFLLPGDIAVGSMTPVADGCARPLRTPANASTATIIEPRKNPFTRARDVAVLRAARRRADERGGGDADRVRRLHLFRQAQFEQQDQHLPRECRRVMDGRLPAARCCFTIRADRFSARTWCGRWSGTLVDVGRGRYTPDGFRSIVESRDLSRSSAGAPAQGLFLSDVVYPADIFERQCFSKFKML